MNDYQMQPATPEDFRALAEMGRQIWQEHYTPIIGPQQVAYMIEHFQSENAIKHQISQENYRYYFLLLNEQRAGYVGIQVGQEGLYLSKLYILKEFRGKGLSKFALPRLIQLAKQENMPKIWLTVNKYNSGSVAAYEKLGFIRTQEQVADIGGGYVMDDFIYELAV